jgi:hypothetical protein
MNSDRRFSKSGTTLLSVALALVFGANSASAVPPDFEKYCETRHPGSSVSEDYVDGSARCMVVDWRKNIHEIVSTDIHIYDVDVAEACRLTTGSTQSTIVYKNYVDCGDGSAKDGRTLTNTDLQNFCIKSLGKMSRYTPGNDEAPLGMCLVPQAGTNIGVNPKSACELIHSTQTFRYAKQDDRLVIVCAAPGK